MINSKKIAVITAILSFAGLYHSPILLIAEALGIMGAILALYQND